MRASDVVDFLDSLDALGVVHWVDGGWGVDCLVGAQTRAHGDLDLVIARDDLGSACALLRARGYTVLRDLLPTAIAVRDGVGREVDLHPVDVMPDGGGEQILPDGTRWRYGAPVPGRIGGRQVRCVGAADQVRMRGEHGHREVDDHDRGVLRGLTAGR